MPWMPSPQASFGHRFRVRYLRHSHIKEREPILDGLQNETAKDKSDAEGPQPALGKVVRVVFDVRIDRRPDAGDDARHEPNPERKRPGVVDVADKSAADECRGNVTDSTNDRSPKATTRKTRTARGSIVRGGTHAARIGEYLADGDENGERDTESEAQNPIESGSESEAANGREQRFPKQGVMIQAASRSVEFNRKCDAGRDTRSQAKEETQAKTVADPEDDGIRYCPGKQPQRPVLSSQQVVSQVETTQHTKTDAGNADCRDCMVVHAPIIEATL